MKHRLAVDTSGSFCSVALQHADGGVFHVESEGNGDHFEQLPRLVDSLVAQASIQVGDLGQILIGIGPGSFTGLRIGMSFVKGLACAVRVPLVGLSSFYAVAKCRAMTGVENGPMLVVSDARRREVFCAEYEITSSDVLEVQPARIVGEHLVEKWISETGGVVVTPLRGWVVEGVQMIVEPRISEGLLALPTSIDGYSVSQIALLEPDYVRGVSAKSIAERRGS